MKLFPIGLVVKLKELNQPVMVIGRWKDKIYFSLAVLFVTALSLLWNIVVQNLMEKINEKRE